jgi:hypothetical protein
LRVVIDAPLFIVKEIWDQRFHPQEVFDSVVGITVEIPLLWKFQSKVGNQLLDSVVQGHIATWFQ